VKPKVVIVDEKEKLVDKVTPSEIVDTIFVAWEKWLNLLLKSYMQVT